MNGTLKDMLHMYVSQNQSDWERCLPIIVHAYRTTVNAATGFSPFRAMRGYEARQPTEDWIGAFRTTSQVTVSEWVDKLSRAMLFTWEMSARRIRKNQENVDNVEPGKRVRIFRPFVVGDLFFMRSIPKRTFTDEERKVWKLTQKLQQRWTGPHLVVEVKNPIIYKCNINGKNRMVHASKMKRDPAANQPFEAWEDDIVDLDVNVEREHEDLQDILAPHSIHELGHKEDDDEFSVSPGPTMDADDKELPSESEEEDELERTEEDDYSKDKSVFVHKWNSRAMIRAPHWNHLGIEPISKRYLGTGVRWVVDTRGDILFRHQTTNEINTQAGFQQQFEDAGGIMPIKEEIVVSGKKTIKAKSSISRSNGGDNSSSLDEYDDSDQYESLNDFPSEAKRRGGGVDSFTRQGVSSSNLNYNAIHQAKMRSISFIEANGIGQSIPIMMTTTAKDGVNEFKVDCATIREFDAKFMREWCLRIITDKQCGEIMTQQEISDSSANDIVLAKWSRKWNR